MFNTRKKQVGLYRNLVMPIRLNSKIWNENIYVAACTIGTIVRLRYVTTMMTFHIYFCIYIFL